MALCQLALGLPEEATRLNEPLQRLAGRLPDWFQGRELVEGVQIHLRLRSSRSEAYELFTSALALAESSDVYGASWLVAEFGALLREYAPTAIDDAVQRYRERPEIHETPRIRERFGVQLSNGAEKC
jgi:hypothetical protein